jgi:hypothetical protein
VRKGLAVVVETDGIRRIDHHLGVEDVPHRRNQLSHLLQPDREYDAGGKKERRRSRMESPPSLVLAGY